MLLRKANYTCQECRQVFSEDELEIDHIYPASRGGHDGDSNLRVLCHNCNNKKRSQDRKQPNKGIQLEFRLGDVPRWSYAKNFHISELDRVKALRMEQNKQATGVEPMA